MNQRLRISNTRLDHYGNIQTHANARPHDIGHDVNSRPSTIVGALIGGT